MVIGIADKKKNLSNYLSKDNARSLNKEWAQEFQAAYTTIILTTFLFLSQSTMIKGTCKQKRLIGFMALHG